MLLLIDPLLNETDYWAPPPGNATRLALNQILPVLGAGLSKLTVDGAPVTMPADMASAPSFASAASALPTVGLLQGGAAAVTRVFHADSCGQASGPTSQLRGDAGDVGGLEYHALRLETVLYDGAGSAVDVRDACRDSGLLRVGLIAAAAAVGEGESGEEALAALEAEVSAAAPSSSFEEGVWAVDVTVRGTRFELARDVTGLSEANAGAIRYRRLNGTDVAAPSDPTAIVVNGKTVATMAQS